MDARIYEGVAALIGGWQPERVYEVGSLNVNGTIRPLFRSARQYHGVDLQAGPCVDAVADGLTHVPPFEPDCVVSCEVLEHAPDAHGLVRRMCALVASGGRVVITCAGPNRRPHRTDGSEANLNGEHYRNISPAELGDWLREAGLSDVSVVCGVWSFGEAGAPLIEDVYAVGTKA